MALTFSFVALLLLIGTPLAVTFGLVVFTQQDSLGVTIVGLSNIPYDVVSSYPLIAIPLFMFTGDLMNRSGMARELIELADVTMQRVRAPFGYIAVFSSAMMGAIIGSSVATVAAVGGIVSPEMARRGYPRGYIAALTATTGLLGVLVPPSIPLILYGATVGVSIAQLFTATLMPALLMGTLFLTVHVVLSRRVLKGGVEHTTEIPDTSWGNTLKVLRRAGPTLFLPVLILGGIYGGLMTPTEAAAVSCIYAVLASVVRRQLDRRTLIKSIRQAAITGSAILIIISMTGVFNRAMVLNQVPQDVANWVATEMQNPVVFLLAVNVVLLAVGTFMETNAAVLLMGPLLAPAAARFNIDPVHFGIITVTNIELGLLTPPMAANLYVAARTAEVRLPQMMSYRGFFLVAALVGQGLITFVPFFSLWYR